jgi:hypothetical protein
MFSRGIQQCRPNCVVRMLIHRPSAQQLASCDCALQIPGPIVSAISKVLGPLLSDQQGPSIVMVSSNAGQGGAAGAGLFNGAPGPLGEPVRPAAAAGSGFGAVVEPSAESVSALVAMGFSRDQAVRALQQSGNDVQTAISLLVGGS